MAYQLRVARFPSHRDLAGFDFTQASVDEGLVRELHQLVLIGGPGTGKTHLATSFGIEAIREHSKRVLFFSTVDLVNALELEKAIDVPVIRDQVASILEGGRDAFIQRKEKYEF